MSLDLTFYLYTCSKILACSLNTCPKMAEINWTIPSYFRDSLSVTENMTLTLMTESSQTVDVMMVLSTIIAWNCC